MNKTNQYMIDTFVKILPYLIILTIALGFSFVLILKIPGFATRGLLIAIPLLFSSIFLIYFEKNRIVIENKILLNYSQRTLSLLYFIVFFITIILLMLSNFRSWLYMGTTLILFIIIFIQVFSQKPCYWLILLEISMLLLNVIYSVTLKYPFYFGGTDLIPHIYMAETTYMTGHIIPETLSSYSQFPLYHILISESSYLLGLDIKNSLFIITGLIFLITIPLAFLIFVEITQSLKVSLLGCLLYSASSTTLYYGTYVVTRTLAFVGFLMLLYFIYKAPKKRNTVVYKLLLIGISIFIVLTHQASLLQISLILFMLFILESFFVEKRYIKVNYFLLLNIMFISYWFFASYSFISAAIQTRLFPSLTEDVSISEAIDPVNVPTFILTNIEMAVFIFFAMMGIGYILQANDKKNNYYNVFGLFVLSTLILYVPNPILAFSQTNDLLLFDRFQLLLVPFMALTMAFGFILSYYIFNFMFNKNKISFIILLIFFAIFTFTSLIYSVSDSHDLLVNSPNAYFTNEELHNFNHILNIVPINSTLYSDYYARKFFIKPLSPNSYNVAFETVFDPKIINPSSFYSNDGNYYLIRENEFKSRGLYFTNENNNNYIYSPSEFNNSGFSSYLKNINKIYSSKIVTVFRS